MKKDQGQYINGFLGAENMLKAYTVEYRMKNNKIQAHERLEI